MRTGIAVVLVLVLSAAGQLLWESGPNGLGEQARRVVFVSDNVHAASAAAVVARQVRVECGGALDCSGELYRHTFVEEQGDWQPRPEDFHGECMVCESCDGDENCESIPPAACHWPGCGNNVAGDVYDEILEAASRGDVAHMIAVGQRIPELIRVHPERRSLQVLSCANGETIANVPLGPLYTVAVAALPVQQQSTIGL